MMRYDIYCNYFKKVEESKGDGQEIDFLQSQKTFDFKAIASDISILETAFAKYGPDRLKYLLICATCLVALFIISW